MAKREGHKAGPGASKVGKVRVVVLSALAALVALSGFTAYRLSQTSKTARDWKPGEVVVGSERVVRRITGLPTQDATDLNASDRSALWLAAFEAVQTGACMEVTGGGVQSPSTVEKPGIYYVSCGADAAETASRKWYREDGHGVVACADAACVTP